MPATARAHSSFHFEHLPASIQARICELVSTPGSPAYAVLACVSKSCSAAALEPIEFDGTAITVQVPWEPGWDAYLLRTHEQRAYQRLHSLARWLWCRGHLVTSLTVEHVGPRVEGSNCEYGDLWGVEDVLGALAALARKPQGLRLRQLQLPAIGSVSSERLGIHLQALQQLQQLHLSSCHGPYKPSVWYYPPDIWKVHLGPALQQLTQLTSLTLDFGDHGYPVHDLNLADVIGDLPCSLEAFTLLGAVQQFSSFYVDCLTHLVALKQLTLPEIACGCSNPDAARDLLAALTALTYLDYPRVLLHESGAEVLLALPNLVQVHAGVCGPWGARALKVLAGTSTLRSLSIQELEMHTTEQWVWQLPEVVWGEELEDNAAALARLNQLTHLHVLVRPGFHEHATQSQMLGQALSSLTGLRSLAVEPEVLQCVQMSALTALQQLTVDIQRSQLTPEQLERLLGRLPAALEVKRMSVAIAQPLQANPVPPQPQQQQEGDPAPEALAAPASSASSAAPPRLLGSRVAVAVRPPLAAAAAPCAAPSSAGVLSDAGEATSVLRPRPMHRIYQARPGFPPQLASRGQLRGPAVQLQAAAGPPLAPQQAQRHMAWQGPPVFTQQQQQQQQQQQRQQQLLGVYSIQLPRVQQDGRVVLVVQPVQQRGLSAGSGQLLPLMRQQQCQPDNGYIQQSPAPQQYVLPGPHHHHQQPQQQQPLIVVQQEQLQPVHQQRGVWQGQLQDSYCTPGWDPQQQGRSQDNPPLAWWQQQQQQQQAQLQQGNPIAGRDQQQQAQLQLSNPAMGWERQGQQQQQAVIGRGQQPQPPQLRALGHYTQQQQQGGNSVWAGFQQAAGAAAAGTGPPLNRQPWGAGGHPPLPTHPAGGMWSGPLPAVPPQAPQLQGAGLPVGWTAQLPAATIGAAAAAGGQLFAAPGQGCVAPTGYGISSVAQQGGCGGLPGIGQFQPQGHGGHGGYAG